MKNLRRIVSALLSVLIILPLLISNPAVADSVNPFDRLLGVFRGSYVSHDGYLWRVTISVYDYGRTIVEREWDPSDSANRPSDPGPFSWYARAWVDPVDNVYGLEFQSWINPPAHGTVFEGRSSVSGTLSSDGNVLSLRNFVPPWSESYSMMDETFILYRIGDSKTVASSAYSIIPEITVRGPHPTDILITLTDVASDVVVTTYHDGTETELLYFLTQDSTLRFNCDVFLTSSSQSSPYKAGETIRFSDYSDGGIDSESLVHVTDRFRTQMSFRPIAAHSLYTDFGTTEVRSIYSRESDKPLIIDPYEAPPDVYKTLEITSQSFGNYAETIKHTVYKSPNGHITDVTVGEATVDFVEYDGSGNKLSSKSIEFELPVFGAFFRGNEHIYMVFGQENREKDDSKELIRIVKYDDNLNRLGEASIYGGDAMATLPFWYGSARLSENGTMLAFTTARLMYNGHQANLTLTVDTETMTPIVDTMNANSLQTTGVSHSFDQYVLHDGNARIHIDLGDANPRAVLLQIVEIAPGRTSSYRQGQAISSRYIIHEIDGQHGANYTGVAVGGLEKSDTHYLTAFSTIDFDAIDEFDLSRGENAAVPTNIDEININRNVVVAALPRLSAVHFSSPPEVEAVTIAEYWGSNKGAGRPQLLPNDDGTFTVLWEVYSLNTVTTIINNWYVTGVSDTSYDVKFEYALTQKIDGSGNPVGNQTRYASRADFYMEYLGIGFFPEAPEIAMPDTTDEISVIVNGMSVVFDQPPIIENGRTLVPLRAIFESLGAEVEWDQPTQTVTAVRGDTTIALTIGSRILTKNGEEVMLDVPAQIVNSRTLVPVRAIAESFGAEVGWDQNTRTVTITERIRAVGQATHPRSATIWGEPSPLSPDELSVLAEIEGILVSYSRGNAQPQSMTMLLADRNQAFMNICRKYADNDAPFTYRTDGSHQWGIMYNHRSGENTAKYEGFSIWWCTDWDNGTFYTAGVHFRDDIFQNGGMNSWNFVNGVAGPNMNRLTTRVDERGNITVEYP